MFVGGTYLSVFGYLLQQNIAIYDVMHAAAQITDIYSVFKLFSPKDIFQRLNVRSSQILSGFFRHRQHLVAAREVTDISQYEREDSIRMFLPPMTNPWRMEG